MKLIRYGDMNRDSLRLLAHPFGARRNDMISLLVGAVPPPELVINRPKLRIPHRTRPMAYDETAEAGRDED